MLLVINTKYTGHGIVLKKFMDIEQNVLENLSNLLFMDVLLIFSCMVSCIHGI